MDQVTVHCPHCQTALHGPPEAIGRRVKCASCDQYFVVPQEQLEETISSWIEQDVDDVLSTRDEQLEQRLSTPPPDPDPEAEATEQASEQTPAQRRRSDRSRRIGGRLARRRYEKGAPSLDYDLRKTPKREQKPDGKPSGSAAQAQPPATPEQGSTATRKAAEAKASSEEPAGEPAPEQPAFPQALFITEPQPHLVVQNCDQAGVRFAFDSRWLAHEGFRASIPSRCVFSGNADRSQLIARPLVFADRMRSHDRKHTTGEGLAQRHENRMIGDRTARDIDRLMGQLEGMPHPFNQSMPYYVSNAYAHLYVHCRTRDRSDDGGVTCEVLIPDLPTALEWLGRVNGVCGQAYELLARQSESLHGQAWEALSEQARKRVSGWCKLDPRETMHLYLNDADFARRDEGMAGLVVTDNRLVFRKYHHRGQVELSQDNALILAKEDGNFVTLTLMLDSERQRMTKIHRNQLDQLSSALEQAGASIQLTLNE